jgi:hypothetical protein
MSFSTPTRGGLPHPTGLFPISNSHFWITRLVPRIEEADAFERIRFVCSTYLNFAAVAAKTWSDQRCILTKQRSVQ